MTKFSNFIIVKNPEALTKTHCSKFDRYVEYCPDCECHNINCELAYCWSLEEARKQHVTLPNKFYG